MLAYPTVLLLSMVVICRQSFLADQAALLHYTARSGDVKMLLGPYGISGRCLRTHGFFLIIVYNGNGMILMSCTKSNLEALKLGYFLILVNTTTAFF